MADAKKIKIGGIWYNVKDETARNGLAGKVNKSGDTMTGNLTIKSSNIDTEATSIDSYTTSEFSIRDKNNKYVSYLISGQATNGNINTALAARKIVNSANVDNSLTLRVNTDGTKSVAVSDPDAWRNGLGAQNGIWPISLGGTGGTDSGRKSLSNSSVYSGMIYYRKIGVFVYLYLDGVQVKTDISASTIRDLATLPEGYRPTHPSGASLFGFAGNAGNPGIISITTSGVISFTPMSAWSVNAILRGSIMYCI